MNTLLPRWRRVIRHGVTFVAVILVLCFARWTHAQPTITQTIDILPGPDTFNPRFVAIDESRDRLYVLGSGLSICEGSGLSVITGVDLGEHFTGSSVAVDGGRNRAYVFGGRINPMNGSDPENGPKVKVIDGVSKTVMQTIPLPAESNGEGFIVVNKATNKLYVANSGAVNPRTYAVDLENGAAVATITGVGADFPGGLAVNETTNRIYFTYVHGLTVPRVHVINGNTDTLETTLDTAASGPPLVDEERNKVYIPGATSDAGGNPIQRVSVINGASGAIEASLGGDFDFAYEPDHGFGFSLNPVFDAVGDKLYLNSTATGGAATRRAIVLNVAAAFQKIGTLDGMEPGTALNATTQKMYFPGNATTGAHTVVQLDVATQALAKLTTGVSVGNVVYEAASDRLWAVDSLDDQIYVINAANGVVEASHRLAGRGSFFSYLAPHRRALALNPATNRLYVASFPPPFLGDTTGFVEVIDTTTKQKVATVPFPSVNLLELAVDPVANRIYGGSSASSGNAENIVVINGATNTTTTLPTVGVGMFVEPALNRLWTTNDSLSGELTENNLTTGAEVRSTGEVFTRPYGLSVHRGSGKILLANGYLNSVDFLKLSDLSVEHSIQFAGTGADFNRVHVVETNPTNTEGYALLEYDDDTKPFLKVLNLASNSATAEVLLPGRFPGGMPTGMALNAGARELYIANGGHGTISVVGGLGAPDGGGGGGGLLQLTLAASSTTDAAAGATAYPGDVITYTVGIRNAGTQPMDRVEISSPIPANTLVDSSSVRQSGGRVRGKSVVWSIKSLPPEATARSLTFSVKVQDTTTALGSSITNATTSAFARGVDAVTAPTLTTDVLNPLEATALSLQATTLPGGFVEFRVKVRNRGNIPARLVEVTLPVPANCGLALGGSGPAYLDANGDVMQRIPRALLANGKSRVLRTSGRSPYIHPENGNAINPGWPADRRSVSWFLGDMAPGEEQVLRMTARLRFDDKDSAAVALPALQLRRKIKAIGVVGVFAGPVPSPTVNHPAIDPEIPPLEPELFLYVDAEGAGKDMEDENDPLTLITTTAKPVPGAVPSRATNQICYTVTCANSGRVVAESLRVMLLVPPGTVLDRKSVFTTNANNQLEQLSLKKVRVTNFTNGADVPEVEDELANGGFLVLDVPFLEPGYPVVEGSGKTVRYTVTLKQKRGVPAIGDQLGMFGIIQSDMFNGLPFFNAAGLSTPLVRRTLIVEPIVFQTEHADAVLSEGADNRVLSAQAFYRNTGGTKAVSVVAMATIPEGATYEPGSAQLLNENGENVLSGQPTVDAVNKRVLMPLNSYAPRQRAGTLNPGQALQVKLRYLTSNAAVPESDVPSVRASSVTPSFFLHHAGDPLPATPLAAARSRRLAAASTSSSSQRDVTTYARKPSDPVWFVDVGGYGPVSPGEQITFLVSYGNTSSGSDVGLVEFPIPANTSYVSKTGAVGTGTLGSVQYFAIDGNNPYEAVRANLGGANSAAAFAVTVQVAAQPTESEIVVRGVNMGKRQGGYVFASDLRIPIVGATTAPGDRASIVRSALRSGAPVAAGLTININSANVEFANDVARITARTRLSATAGASYIHLKSGQRIIPIGDGKVVVAGNPRVVGNDGAGVVANDGAGVVANDGAGIVAVGAGNLIGIHGVVADLTQPNLYNVIATVIKEQRDTLLPGASIVAGGGGNIVAGGGLNLIGQDGASLIGQDGAGLRALVNNETGGPIFFSGQPVLLSAQLKFVPAAAEKLRRLPEGLKIGLVPQVGPSVITLGDSAISLGSDGHLASKLLGDNGAGIVGDNSAGIVAVGGGNIVAAGGGNLIGDGGGLISQ
jgi:uncharacterized repeat protein (TIGR01451 family)